MSFQPATPQSPSQLSPNTSDLMNSSMSSSATCATTNTLPTPAHSVNGSSMATEMTSMGGDSPQNKRKRPLDDMGDRDRKKAHTEGHRLGIEDLHLDVGMKYLVCKTQLPAKKPDISLDLIEMYGLTDIAAEVARVLPNGEKNAIRKTYKGHIKKLEVAGVWDSVKSVDMKAPDHLFTMCQIPEHDWNVHFVHGKDIEGGFSAETKAKLHRATAMVKGVLPKSMWDSSVLGDMAPGKGRQSARPTAPNTPVVTGTGVPRAKPLTPAAQDANRPKRNIKKRGYGESSYEGYEGYDDGAETGYSTGEGESHKKIKKSHLGSANTKPFAASQQHAVSSSAM